MLYSSSVGGKTCQGVRGGVFRFFGDFGRGLFALFQAQIRKIGFWNFYAGVLGGVGDVCRPHFELLPQCEFVEFLNHEFSLK